MVTDWDELDVTMHSLMVQCTGLPENRVIKANQDRPEPSNDLYLTWNAVPVRAVGQPRRTMEEIPEIEPSDYANWTDLKETVISQLDMILSVNCINSGAKNLAWKVHQANYLNSVASFCAANGIGWRYASPARRLTGLQQAAYQSRYQVDINLYIETAISDTLLAAASAPVILYDEDGNIIAEG